jgi:hypothetical protein
LRRERSKPGKSIALLSIGVSLGKPALDDDVLALDKPALAQSIEEGLASRLRRDGRIIRQE